MYSGCKMCTQRDPDLVISFWAIAESFGNDEMEKKKSISARQCRWTWNTVVTEPTDCSSQFPAPFAGCESSIVQSHPLEISEWCFRKHYWNHGKLFMFQPCILGSPLGHSHQYGYVPRIERAKQKFLKVSLPKWTIHELLPKQFIHIVSYTYHSKHNHILVNAHCID